MNNHFDLYELPIELQCRIISEINEYRDILRLRLVNRHMLLLLEKSIRKIDREYIKNHHINISCNIIATFRNLNSVSDCFPESIDELINISNLQHLKQTHIGIDYNSLLVKKFNLSFDQILSIFVSQYCSGTFLLNNSVTGIINIYKNKRTFRNTSFWIEYYGTSLKDSKDVLIDNGIVSIYKYSSQYQLFLKTLAREHTLFGIELEYPLIPDIITLLENTIEFEEIIIRDALTFNNSKKRLKILNQIVYFINLDKIKIVRQNHDYDTPDISIIRLFLELFSFPNNKLEIWDIPIEFSDIITVMRKFPKLKEITIRLNDNDKNDNILIKEIENLGNLIKLNNYQLDKIFFIDLTGNLCQKYQTILKNIIQRNIIIDYI